MNMHIVWIMANNSSAPYFNWFAERAAEEKNLKVTFVCLYPHRPQMIDDVKKYGWDCYWFYFDHKKRKRGMLSLVPKLYSLFKKIKPDIVHSHLFDDALPALFSARLSGVKIRVITKGDAGIHYNYYPQWMPFDIFNNWNATHIVALSKQSQKFIIEKEKANPENVFLIHHGIPIRNLTAQSDDIKRNLIEQFGLNKKIVIGTVSRLIELKGYRYIIDAAEKVVQKYPEVKFLFVGTGDQKQELQVLITEKKLTEHIVFTGWIERSNMPSLYGIMDIYLHASISESFGLVIAEAMANAVPVIATKTGAALDIIEHLKNGYLVSEKNSEEITEGVFFMLENDRKKIGEEGKKVVINQYNFEKMFLKHIELYKTALKE